MHACRDAGIRTIWRRPGTPHYGGHIERLIGTQMGAVHLLPGTTFSNPEDRAGYDSGGEAHLTRLLGAAPAEGFQQDGMATQGAQGGSNPP